MTDAAAPEPEGPRGAVPLTGGEAGEARSAGGGLLAVAGVLFAGAGPSFAAVAFGQAVGTECPLGAFHLTFGTLPSSSAAAWLERGRE